MKQLLSAIAKAVMLAVVVFAGVSCSTRPNVAAGEPPQISVEQDKNGDTVLRLHGEGTGGVWKLKDKQNDVLVRRTDHGLLAIKARLTLENGQSDIVTQIKATPGEKIPLGGMGKMTFIIMPER
jgi:hypothetical protein